MNPSTHCMLISAQAAPNILPVLDPALKPERVIMVVSRRMHTQADAIESVLSEAAVKVERVALANEHDYARNCEDLLDVALRHQGPGVALNLTGGTKLMALAAQAVAVQAHWRMFYVDVDTDEVIWLGDAAAPRQAIATQARLNHYFRAHGYTPDRGAGPVPPTRQEIELMDTLLLQIGSLERALSQLNFLAQQAHDQRRLHARLEGAQANEPNLAALLRLFEQAGALAVQGNTVRFASESALAFTKGGWLEHHVYRIIAGLQGALRLRDKAANLNVTDRDGVRNELDVCFMARNRLFVVECKTARMDKDDRPKANDALFKLAEVCRRVGGLGTRGMLASYRPLRDSEKKLAHVLGIELVCGTELARLRERVMQWVGPAAA